jgi:hypothetical protein
MNLKTQFAKVIDIPCNEREAMFQSRGGNLSIGNIERQPKALAFGFQPSPALRNGVRHRQNSTGEPFPHFHFKPLLQFATPFPGVEQFAAFPYLSKRDNADEN